jgi:hypothetical protein
MTAKKSKKTKNEKDAVTEALQEGKLTRQKQ